MKKTREQQIEEIENEIGHLQIRLTYLKNESEIEETFKKNKHYDLILKYFDIDYKYNCIDLKEEYRSSAQTNFDFRIGNGGIIFVFYDSLGKENIGGLKNILKLILEESKESEDYYKKRINDEQKCQKLFDQIISELTED